MRCLPEDVGQIVSRAGKTSAGDRNTTCGCYASWLNGVSPSARGRLVVTSGEIGQKGSEELGGVRTAQLRLSELHTVGHRPLVKRQCGIFHLYVKHKVRRAQAPAPLMELRHVRNLILLRIKRDHSDPAL
ncbi:hypothetical protein F2P81_001575 [Scophthalmus maximus]|uniref:Uncharacterized protein n=1 Tax=Scophthalmus maximus TaxID=52904 RepID=A0A6A4TBR6_SCOMX|nr:hypothetical protein F2P81_001575 [Scophthalmus maximus]